MDARGEESGEWLYPQITQLVEAEILFSAEGYLLAQDAGRRAFFMGRAMGAVRVWRDLTLGLRRDGDLARIERLFDGLVVCDEALEV